jgi:hypothetical protein
VADIIYYIAAVQSVTTKSGARHLAEIAALVGGAGAFALIVGGGFGLRWIPGGGDSGRAERLAYLVGGLLIGVAFLLLLLAIHGGFGSVTVR